MVERDLHDLGVRSHQYGSSIPLELSVDNLAQRASICASLPCRQKHEAFLERIINGDKRWACHMLTLIAGNSAWFHPG